MKKKCIAIISFVVLLCMGIGLNAQTYVIPSVTYPTIDEDIRYVLFGSMTNTTSCGVLASGPGSIAGAYSNFTGSTGAPNLAGSVAAPVCAIGSSYPLAVGVAACGNFAYNGIIGVFIDFNQNGSFLDSGELVWTSSYGPAWLSTTPPGYSLYPAPNVTIPCTALPGLTRLRVWHSETSSMTGPNGSILWGEVEDYAINIVNGVSNLITIVPANPIVCPGGNVALTAAGATSYTWSGGITNGVAFSPTASAVYTVFANTGSCIVTNTVLVKYNPPLSISAPTTNICGVNTVTLTASGATSYSWSNGATTSGIIVTPSVTTTYTVYNNSVSTCTIPGIATVSVTASVPSLTVTTNNGTNGTCPNTPVSLVATGATSYSWTGGVVNGVPFTLPGTSSYTVTGTNICGTSTAAISLSIHPLPNVTASVNNPTVCSGGQVILTGSGAATYIWIPTAPNNVAFSPGATAMYTVVGTNSVGCTASAVQGVTVFISPTITPVATPTAICFGSTATLSAGGATGFTWTPGTALYTASITVSPPVSTTYTLFRTNGPCSSTSTLNLVVSPIPPLNVNVQSGQLCAGSAVNMTISGVATSTIFPSGATGTNVTVYPSTSMTYTVLGSSGACVMSALVPLLVNPSPTISITSSTNTICEGQIVSLTANVAGALSYTWQPINSNNTTVNTILMTTTVFSLSAINTLGCINTQTQLIVVLPAPNMSLASNPPFICASQTVVLSVANPSNNIIYNWSTGVSGTSLQVNPAVTTNYSATGINTITGCQNTNTIVLSVYVATFVVASPVGLCIGSTATLTATGPPTSYSWTSNGGVPIAVGPPSVAVSPLINSTYFVTGTNGGCSSTQSVDVIVNPLPNVGASVAKKTICRYEVSTLTGNGATSYSWNTGANTPTISLTLSLTTTYTVTGTDTNGCSNTATVTQFVATCIGIEELTAGEALINIYPNPNNGNFTISSESVIKLSIVNALGQVINMISLNEENKKQVTVSSLPEGVYFITGEHTGLRVNKKLVIEK